jgi:hypothetical protein
MNMTDLVALTQSLDRTKTVHRILFFQGKHEWAPDSTMNRAFAGLQMDAMRRGLLARDEAFVQRYAGRSRDRVEGYQRGGQLIGTMRECAVSISFLDGLSPAADWFRKHADSLSGTPAYRQQRQAEQETLAREEGIKEEYARHFQQPDMHYWASTISALQAQADPMDQRLLAYLSLAFYSFSNRSINGGANDQARYFVELYKMADPTNSEAWYLSAVLDVREGHPADAGADLKKAAGLGFVDRARMLAQPEFQSGVSLPQ